MKMDLAANMEAWKARVKSAMEHKDEDNGEESDDAEGEDDDGQDAVCEHSAFQHGGLLEGEGGWDSVRVIWRGRGERERERERAPGKTVRTSDVHSLQEGGVDRLGLGARLACHKQRGRAAGQAD